MNRRALLSTAAGVATAGCLGPAFGLGSDCARGASFRLRSVTDADVAVAKSDPVDELAPPRRRAVADAHHGADATLWHHADDAPFSGTEYVRVDGAYVTVDTSEVSSTERTGYEFSLETAESDDGVAFADLPAVDRTALYVALGDGTVRKLRASENVRSVRIGGTLVYPDDDAEGRSALVPDPSHAVVRIGGHPVRFRITDTDPTTVATSRVLVRTLAESPTAFAAVVYDRHGVDLDERTLSAEQRDVVETAIEGGYDECAPYSDAYADLQAILGGTGPEAGDRVDYANYRDQWYAVELWEDVV